MTNKTTAGIIGGGISGLATARYLKKKGISVTVYEKGAEAGGVIQTSAKDGWLVERGANTLMLRTVKARDLVHELDLDSELVGAGAGANNRFVVKNGRPVPLPLGPGSFIATSLISASAKARILAEPFIAGAGGPGAERESVADFFSRRFGEEVLNYAVDPFVAGIYAGSPEQLSIRHTFPSLYESERDHGSVLKGFFRKRKGRDSSSPPSKLASFKNGMQVLPNRLAEQLGDSLRTGTAVAAIERDNDEWRLGFSDGSDARHDILVSTVPAYVLADLLPGSVGDAARKTLKKLVYAPVSIVSLGFRRSQVGHPLDGFGMLVPSSEPFDILGALFSSSLFPGRAPDGHVLLTTFVGGTRNPHQAGQPADALFSKVIPEVSRLLDIEGSPVFTHHAYWEKAIPQYGLDYDEFLDAIGEIESSCQGLFARGNMRGGVSVPDCIASAGETADEVEMFLSTDNGISTFGT